MNMTFPTGLEAALLDLRKHARDLSSVAQTVATISGAASGLTSLGGTWDTREQALHAALAYVDDLDQLMVKCRAAVRAVKQTIPTKDRGVHHAT